MPTITYNINIPQPTDRPSASQPQLLANFQGINQLVDVNHYPFASTNAGKHKYLQLPIVEAPVTIPTTAANELALYTQLDAVSGLNQMYIRRPGDGVQIPFTAKGEGGAISGTSQGWTYLPSGILMKWGATNDAAPPAVPFDRSIDTNVAVPGSPSFGANRFNVWVIGFQSFGNENIDSNLAYYLRSIDSNKDFTLRIFSRNGGAIPPGINYRFCWFAIGPGI